MPRSCRSAVGTGAPPGVALTAKWIRELTGVTVAIEIDSLPSPTHRSSPSRRTTRRAPSRASTSAACAASSRWRCTASSRSGSVNDSQTKWTMSSPAMPGPSMSARSAISPLHRHGPRKPTSRIVDELAARPQPVRPQLAAVVGSRRLDPVNFHDGFCTPSPSAFAVRCGSGARGTTPQPSPCCSQPAGDRGTGIARLPRALAASRSSPVR
jgi:hypothetical protein